MRNTLSLTLALFSTLSVFSQPVVLLDSDRLEAPERAIYGKTRLNSGWVGEGAAFRYQVTPAAGVVNYVFGLAAPTGCSLRVEFLNRARKSVAPSVNVPAGMTARRVGSFRADDLRYVRIVPSVSVAPKGLFVAPFRLTVDWALDENFSYQSSGAVPAGWKAQGAAVVSRPYRAAWRKPGEPYLTSSRSAADNVLSIAPGGFAEPSVDRTLLTDEYAFGFSARMDADTDFTVGGLDVRQLGVACPGIWQNLRFERCGGRERLRVNGRVVAEDLKFGGFRIVNRNRERPLVLDDFRAFALVNPADYPSAPKVPRGAEKNLVGINVCSLWHNGIHYGWHCVNAVGDRKPVLGYYDEGLPETADWEIKYLVEAGVDFQAFCWYASSNSDELRHFRLVHHLEDGFKCARYSHRMKYCLIWEVMNAGAPDSLEAWKRHYVPYLIEHHFRDPRYLKIDGKVVFAVYESKRLLLPSTLGSAETVRAAFDYLDAEVKKIGLKGVMLVASQSKTNEAEPAMAAMGFAADVAYNYVRESGIPSENRRLNRLRRSWYGSQAVSSVAVGFDWYPWTGQHNPMMSAADFADTLKWCRDEFAAYPFKHFFWLSTWNEYGEGTYLMPTEQRGFGCLDGVRKVLTDETTPQPHTVPTPAQRARLCRLYTEIAAQDPVVPDRSEWIEGAREVGDGSLMLDGRKADGSTFNRQVSKAQAIREYVGARAPAPVRRIKSGVRERFGAVNFTVTLTEKSIRLKANVRDGDRHLPPKNRPWAGDALDLYIDPTPFADLAQNRSKSIQMFAFPDGTFRVMEESFDSRQVVLSAKDGKDGYSFDLTIPWTAFGCAPQTAIGLNMIYDDLNSGETKVRSRVWCDGPAPYVSRFTWALVESQSTVRPADRTDISRHD